MSVLWRRRSVEENAADDDASLPVKESTDPNDKSSEPNEKSTAPEAKSTDPEGPSLITRTDLHLVLVCVAAILALVGSRYDLVMHITGAALVTCGGFSVLQVPKDKLVAHGLDPTAVRYLTSLACWVATLVVVYCCGSCLGLTSGRPSDQVLLALAIGIGTGAQPLLANLSAGLLLVMQRPFRVGDWVTVGGQTLEVTSIMSFVTYGKNATSHVMVPNAQVIGATIANLSARPAHLLIVPVHVRSGLHPCSKVRKAMATAAVAFDAALADTLERAGVADSAAAASRLPKASYFGPLEVGERGMKWELRCEAPMQAQLHCTGLANECVHDALMAASIKMYEAAPECLM